MIAKRSVTTNGTVHRRGAETQRVAETRPDEEGDGIEPQSAQRTQRERERGFEVGGEVNTHTT